MQEAPIDRKDLPSPSDRELWFALRSGQTGALGQLYDRHASLVYGLSLKVLGNTQEAEDLTQDIFIKLAERSSYDPDRGSLRTFLMVLTRSRAIDRLRSRQSASRSRRVMQANFATNPPVQHTDTIIQAEQSAAVKAALSQLPAPEQQVLQMAYYEGLTQAAIAEHLRTPLGTIKSRTRRGLLKLRQILQAQKEADGNG